MTTDHTASEERPLECQDIHRALRAGSPLTAAERAHADACPACAVLVQDAALAQALSMSEAEAPTPDPELPPRLAETIAAPPSVRDRLREMPTRWRLAAAVVGALVIPVLVFGTWRRPDLSVYPLGRLLVDLGTFLVPALLALWVAMRPMHRSELPRAVEPGLVMLGLAGMFALAALPVAHHDHPASLLGVGDDLVPRARACFLTGTAAGLPVLLWVRALLRDDGPWWLVMVLLAITAALVGGLSVFMHCPLVSPVHLAAGHATVAIPFLAVATVGRFARAPARELDPEPS